MKKLAEKYNVEKKVCRKYVKKFHRPPVFSFPPPLPFPSSRDENDD
jgi:hypothetical protein